MTIAVKNFPEVNAVADVRVAFGATVGIVSSVKSSASNTLIEVVTPRLDFAGAVDTTIAHLTSARRAVVTFQTAFYAEAVGAPVVETVQPNAALLTSILAPFQSIKA